MATPNKAEADFLSVWLEQLGLSTYLQAFLDNDVDAGILPHLTSTDLVELGVTSVGHRRRLLDAIARLGVEQNPRPEPKEKAAPALRARQRDSRRGTASRAPEDEATRPQDAE